MTSLTTSAALTVAAFASAFAFGAGTASAAGCDGSWSRSGRSIERQCYYLPTVSNGRVTGVEMKQNFRHIKQQPGAIIGGVTNPYYNGGKSK